jgi:hypothetical protein
VATELFEGLEINDAGSGHKFGIARRPSHIVRIGAISQCANSNCAGAAAGRSKRLI